MRFMSWSLSTLGLCLLTTGFAVAQQPATPEEPATAEQIREGKRIFEYDWKASGPMHPKSDGLGPAFNDVSCVGCHKLGGTGGAGANDKNVDLLSLVSPSGDTSAKRRATMRENASRLHPGFGGFGGGNSTLIMHSFATDATYAPWRQDILDKVALPVAAIGKPVPKVGIIAIKRTQRSTPALFGAGLIDAISDQVLIEAAEKQASLSGISGRVPQTASGAVGRFGWRGQTAHLRDFVLTACAVELGLQVPGHEQAKDPRAPNYKAPGLDLTANQCDALVAYVAHLPTPSRSQGAHLQVSLNVHQGSKLFASIGCADCHLPNLGEVEGIYSDLLLHDMGPDLADPVAAVPELTTASGGFSASYYGSSALDLVRATTNVQQEWRTPPLWGVAASGPYLHDGRAASLDEAVRAHGGEARNAAQRYVGLSAQDQNLVIQFLQSLVAPRAATSASGGGT